MVKFVKVVLHVKEDFVYSLWAYYDIIKWDSCGSV
jgi:hypothetical protein